MIDGWGHRRAGKAATTGDLRRRPAATQWPPRLQGIPGRPEAGPSPEANTREPLQADHAGPPEQPKLERKRSNHSESFRRMGREV